MCAGQAGATHQHPTRDPGVPSCLAQPPEHPHAIYSRMAEAAAAPVACMKLFSRPHTGLAAGRKLQLDPGSLAATLQQSRGLVGLDPRLYVTEQALGLQVGLSRSKDSKLDCGYGGSCKRVSYSWCTRCRARRVMRCPGSGHQRGRLRLPKRGRKDGSLGGVCLRLLAGLGANNVNAWAYWLA